MTTNTYRSTRTNVPGASARHQAAQLRKDKAKWDVAPRQKPSTELVPRRPSVRQSAGFAVIGGLAGLYVNGFVALVSAVAVFVVVKSLVVGHTSRRKPAPPPRMGQRSWVPPTQKDLSTADNYELGAEGEEETGRILSVLEREGWTILHDRRIENSTANLDHIAVGPRGQVVVIDSKKRRPVAGAVLRLSRDGNGLRYGDFDWSGIVSAVQAEVRLAQGEMLVEPTAMVVVHGVEFGSMRVMRCGGVLVVHPDKLVERLRMEPKVTDKSWIAGHLDRTFPPYLD
ncbi:NERD domain-containing protein [Kitasatospora sp. NPDC101155]|uniref:NERD domain-containing protein n=1 Tax=Kitasatospora sp. NPDC101155 TaxID=3364097 RepID=UPI0037F357F0